MKIKLVSSNQFRRLPGVQTLREDKRFDIAKYQNLVEGRYYPEDAKCKTGKPEDVAPTFTFDTNRCTAGIVSLGNRDIHSHFFFHLLPAGVVTNSGGGYAQATKLHFQSMTKLVAGEFYGNFLAKLRKGQKKGTEIKHDLVLIGQNDRCDNNTIDVQEQKQQALQSTSMADLIKSSLAQGFAGLKQGCQELGICLTHSFSELLGQKSIYHRDPKKDEGPKNPYAVFGASNLYFDPAADTLSLCAQDLHFLPKFVEKPRPLVLSEVDGWKALFDHYSRINIGAGHELCTQNYQRAQDPVALVSHKLEQELTIKDLEQQEQQVIDIKKLAR